ncbi:MAG TPA: hypothetical protein VLQ89_01580, partial [Candidatus Binatia bacterium]|nr:hypothetical protein [Candidatus Binatia bacterium]
MKREKIPGARRPRISAQARMTLLALSLAIPVLLITIIGIGSVARQKQTRALQWRGQWQRQLELSAVGLERALDRSIAASPLLCGVASPDVSQSLTMAMRTNPFSWQEKGESDAHPSLWEE